MFPIYDVSWFIALQKLQLHVRVCLFLEAYGLSAALQVLQIGGVTLMGLTGTIKGEKKCPIGITTLCATFLVAGRQWKTFLHPVAYSNYYVFI